MAGYFAADRAEVNLEDRMAERKGYANEEPKTEMKGAKEGQLHFGKKDGKKEGRKHSRKSSRK
jgi:hypothetical protein